LVGSETKLCKSSHLRPADYDEQAHFIKVNSHRSSQVGSSQGFRRWRVISYILHCYFLYIYNNHLIVDYSRDNYYIRIVH